MKISLLSSGQRQNDFAPKLYRWLHLVGWIQLPEFLLMFVKKRRFSKYFTYPFRCFLLQVYFLLFTHVVYSQEQSPVTVNITADKDNAIFSTELGRNAGSALALHTGRTGGRGGNRIQRAFFHFDLSSIPAGSKVSAASLTLHFTKVGPVSTGVALHKVTANWGEGEATWSHAFLPSTPWATPGGDFEPDASASTGDVSGGPLVISSLTADVQSWVDNASTNFGWLVKVVDEEVTSSAKLIASRENPAEEFRPVLSITYTLSSEWNQRYGGSGNEGFTAIIKTADGGYLSGGYSNSGVSGDKTQPSQGKNDYWIVKSDKNGKKLWDKSYGGTQDDYISRILSTPDGGYLLAGSSLSGIGGDKTQASRGNRDYWVVKIDAKGNKQWDKRYGGTGYDELKKVLLLSTGEYILAGYSNSPIGGDKSQASQGGNDYWLVKIRSNGTKIWDKRYGGNLNESLGGIVQTSDGGFLLGGSSLSGKNGDKSETSRGGSDYWLVRTDKNGLKLWDKSFGGSGQDEAYSLGLKGSDFFISGQSNSPAGGDKTQNSQGKLDFWLVKLNSTGNKIWDKRFGGSDNDELRASVQTSDGGYLLAGKSFSGISGNKTQAIQGASDYWIVKTDEEGQYQWDKRYGGSEEEELRAVIQTADGGFLLAGKSQSGVSGDRTQSSRGGNDFWLVKVAPEINTLVTMQKARLVEHPVLESNLSVLEVFPNPLPDKATVRFRVAESQFVTLKVYNIQGQEVTTLFQETVNANQDYQVVWQAGSRTSGVYLLQLQMLNKRIQQKVLLAK